MDSDAEITRYALAARAGDRAAAASFINATAPQLRRVLRMLCDPGYVDDLVQETYLRAFQALPRYAERSPARLWLLAIARRVAADHVRKAQRSPRVAAEADWQRAAEEATPVPGHGGYVAVAAAVAALEPERREAFVLTRMVGLSYEEAARACGCAVGTIRSRVYRARADLVAALGSGEKAGDFPDHTTRGRSRPPA